MHPVRAALSVAAALLAAAVAARAETIKVSSGLGADLQAALDLAGPGDTLNLSGGPYAGSFLILAGKDGLTLKGQAIIDSPEDTTPFTVNSNGVTFQGLTFRHSSFGVIAGPDALQPPLAGCTIAQCRFIDVRATNAVILEADDVLVTGCSFEGCTGALFLDGDRISVTKTRVLNDDGSLGIFIAGDDATVQKCTLSTIAGDGISVLGDRALVTGNRVTGVDGDGIVVDGADMVVTGNTVAGATGDGIEAAGDAALVSKNKISFCAASGVHVDGSAPVVSSNLVQSMLSGGVGFLIKSGGDADVQHNTAEDVSEDGFRLIMDGGLVAKNKATRCGVGNTVDLGFALLGDDNVLDGNAATDCATTGFGVEGSGNTLSKNKATGCLNNGFLIVELSSVGNLLSGNTAKGNEGEGIQNGGTSTVLLDNSCSGNLLDIASATGDGASIVDAGGNHFATGGFTTEPVVPE